MCHHVDIKFKDIEIKQNKEKKNGIVSIISIIA